jgi:signal transduction histidine kinase
MVFWALALLKEPKLTGKEQREYIRVEKSGDRMLNIIDDIVSVSKIESDKCYLIKRLQLKSKSNLFIPPLRKKLSKKILPSNT